MIYSSTVVDISNSPVRTQDGNIMEFSEFAIQKLLQETGQSEHLTLLFAWRGEVVNKLSCSPGNKIQVILEGMCPEQEL